jgi:hypothetical protein
VFSTAIQKVFKNRPPKKKEIIFYNPSHHSLPTNRNVSAIQYSRISSAGDPGKDGFASRKLDPESFF